MKLSIATLQGQRFDLYPGTKLSIEENSPLFSDAGSFSLPVELPPTHSNLELLEYPHRPDRRRKFITSLPVVVTCGAWIRQARMDIESASRNQNITTSLFFAETPFFAAVKGIKLPEIFKDEIFDYAPDASLEAKLDACFNHLQKVMSGEVTDNYFIFPVCAKIEETEGTHTDGGITVRSYNKRFTILNRPSVAEEQGYGNTAIDPNGNLFYTLHPSPVDYDEQNVLLKLPRGYGWTPFLKFNFVLEKTFAHFGYQFDNFDEENNQQFAKLCIINNTADAFVRGYAVCQQLLPDMDITDFLSVIEDIFCCKFIVNEIRKKITVVFWKNILSATSHGDITRNFEDYPTITPELSKNIKLTMDRSIIGTEPIEVDTYQKMFKKYGNLQGTVASEFGLKLLVSQSMASPGIYFVRDTRTYYSVFSFSPEHSPAYTLTQMAVEKNTLDFHIENEQTAEEHKLNFKIMPLVPVALRGRTATRYEVTSISETSVFAQLYGQYITTYYEQFTPNDGVFARILYTDSVRHLNTAIKTTSTSNGTSTEELKEEQKVDLPLFLAFYHGLAAVEENVPNVERTYFASQDAYNNIGQMKGIFDLSSFSLYNHFWSEYATMINSSLHTISGKAYFNLSEIMQIKFTSVFSYMGQKILPESIQYEISDEGIEVVEFKVKTLKNYE